MRLRKFQPRHEIADVQTDNKQQCSDPQATEDHDLFDEHVRKTPYGLILLPEEPHHISASENEEENQLITDTDNSNNEVTLAEVRPNDTSREPRNTVIPNIRPTHTTEVTR